MLLPGDFLQDRYRIVDMIDRGGMAIVYQAADTRLGDRLVAVKEMDPSNLPASDQEWAVTAFRQEAQVLAQLNHQGIADVSDFFEESGYWYLVMEFVEGESLQKAIDRVDRFDEGQVLVWAGQLVDMLTYLHHRDPPIIFRDLKPANVMVRPDGWLKLIDFGIARFFKPWKGHDTVQLGTPGYAAPEQYGQGQTDIRSDVYSLGVLLHQLLTGYNPSLTPLNLPPVRQLNPEASARVASAISQATQVSPDARFQSIGAFARALGISETAPPPVPVRRIPPLIPIIVAVIILVVAGAVLIIRPWEGAEPGIASTSTPAMDQQITLNPVQVTTIANGPAIVTATSTAVPTQAPTATPMPTATSIPAPTATSQPTPAISGPAADPVARAQLEATYLANAARVRPNDPAIFAYRAETPIQIDGTLDEWAIVPSYPVVAPVAGASNWQGESDLSSDMRLAWDENFLYVALNRVDDHPGKMGTGRFVYEGDSLEIQFDADLAGDFAVDDFDGDDSQLGVSPGNFAEIPAETHQWLPQNRSGSIPGALVAASQTAAGYDMEFAIPWRAMGATPRDGAVYGFTLCTNDNDRLDAADQETMLCAHASRQFMVATSLGTLILATWPEEL
ncbi:MAG: protein kinase [Chloroflexota bacterium]|nr:MAG: protein kinase [Chloroflexota bacterium]